MGVSLADHIHKEITLNGPMGLDRYMGLCLSHPDLGYYMTRDPFGQGGDFTTAPEISQLFGEVVGAWLADQWSRLGAPDDFILCEAGPGRGTLMNDILRVAAAVPAFQKGADLHLLETSPVLKQQQAETLAAYTPTWHADLETLPDDRPIFFIANEFLDALPIQQFQMGEEGWQERVVGLDKNETLCFGLRPIGAEMASSDITLNLDASIDSVLEIAPAASHFTANLAKRLKDQGGAGLIIDYGYAETAYGDTVQALHQHRSVSIFDYIGETDITAHVNFDQISQELRRADLTVSSITPQGMFLKTLGIERRAALIAEKADNVQQNELMSGLARLINPGQMGELFKVLGFTSNIDKLVK